MKGAKKMNIILDCETISKKYQCISDLAWALIERNKIVALKNFIPVEHLSIMADGEFSGPKMAETMAEVTKGRAVIAPWNQIMEVLRADCEKAKRIYAYNAAFDRNATARTCKALRSEYTEYFTSATYTDKWRDLWAWSSNTILYKKSFIDFCEAHGLKTPKGFCSTSAETTLKFIRNNPAYVEQHTARADVLDEFEIYLNIKKEIKREYDELCKDEDATGFKGKPFYTIKKLENAMTE